MLTRSAKRKLQEEEPQIERKYRRGSKLEFRLELGVEREKSDTQVVFLPINEICERYPLVGEIIFTYLDDQSLKQSREVCTTWSTFLDSKPFYWIRMMKNYNECQEEFSDEWKRFFNKLPVETAKKMALYIPKLREVYPEPRSPLHIAATVINCFSLFEYIYEKVAEKNPRDKYGRVPIHYAARNNNLRICKFIHEKRQPLDQRSDNGNTPLHNAANRGYVGIFEYLFESVEEKNPRGYRGMMPIHGAASNGHFEVFKFIYEKSGNKNPQDNKGRMPIHHAASNGHLEICKFIHERGDGLTPLSNDGKTPLTMAASKGHFEVSRFIFGVVEKNLTEAQKAEVVKTIKSQMSDTAMSKLIMSILK